MKRRDFLVNSAAAAVPVLSGVPIGLSARTLSHALTVNPTDRVLVLIQLAGGNDGLNTVVPLDQLDNLNEVRGNIAIPRNKLIDIDANRGLHPALRGLAEVHDQGKLAIIQSVGYPDQNRSHFRSTDIWQSGSPADDVWTQGWMGRNFDKQYPSYPKGYPSAARPDPIAVTVGYSVSETCQGVRQNFGFTTPNPSRSSGLLDSGAGPTPDRAYGRELSFIRESITAANAYGNAVKTAADRGTNTVEYPVKNELAERLSHVARMISGGLRTNLYVVTLGGFDTHDDQVDSGDHTKGAHANRLQLVGDAIAAFQADINAQGLTERVVGMTYSEFGRQIRSNGNRGTDHGTAAPLFLFGSCVQGGVTGSNPYIDKAIDDREGVAMQYDFRDVYGSILEDWFNLDASDVRELLYDDYTRLPIIRGCVDKSIGERGGEEPVTTDGLGLSPNPFDDWSQLTFTTGARGRVSLNAYDSAGRHVENLFDMTLPAGEQSVRLDTRDYPRGPVIFRLQRGSVIRLVRGIRQ